MITFKQFLCEAIGNDSFGGNLPRSEFQKIGRKLVKVGINFDTLKFKRAEPMQFGVARTRLAYIDSWRFNKLPKEYVKNDMEIRKASKRRAITLVAIDPVKHHFVAIAIWGTKVIDRSIVYSNKKDVYDSDSYESLKRLLTGKDTICYYAFTNPVEVAEFEEKREAHLKDIASRIDVVVKQSAAYKSVKAIFDKYGYKLESFENQALTGRLAHDHINYYDIEAAGPGTAVLDGSGRRFIWNIVATQPSIPVKKEAYADYFRTYGWIIRFTVGSNGESVVERVEASPDLAKSKLVDLYKRETPELANRHDELIATWKEVNEKIQKLEPKFEDLAQEVRDFVKNQGFNI